MAKPHVLKGVPPSKVQRLLNTHNTQAEVARRLGVTQSTLSLYMKRHGFKRVQKWERSKEIHS